MGLTWVLPWGGGPTEGFLPKKVGPHTEKTSENLTFRKLFGCFVRGGGPTDGGPSDSPQDDLQGGLKGRNDGPNGRLVRLHHY